MHHDNYLKQYKYYFNCLHKRFMFKKKFSYLLDLRFLNYFYYNFFTTGYFNLIEKIEYDFIFLYLKNNYYTVRFFFNLPYTSRTRCNNNSSFWKRAILINILAKYIFKKKFKKEKDKEILFFVEFYNKLWFFQWRKEWKNAKKKTDEVRDLKYLKWKFGYFFLTLNRPFVFTDKKSKKKINKKKQIEIPRTYNIGFTFGFSFLNKEMIKKFPGRQKFLIKSKNKTYRKEFIYTPK